MTIKPGKYLHYKGNHYEVIGTAEHSETRETLVLYKPLYGAGGYWVRPYDMFVSTVTIGGTVKPRFEYLEPE